MSENKHWAFFSQGTSGASFLFVEMHQLQVIYFLFCPFSIQLALGMNSLPFSFCEGVGGRLAGDRTVGEAVNCIT